MTGQKTRLSIGARRNPETEAAVLDAAEAILAERGFRGLTMEAVARRAHAGKATLYRWWPSRGRLIVAIYERRKGDFRLPDTGALRADIAQFYAALFAFWSTPEGGMFRLIIAGAQAEEDLAEALETYRSERIGGLRRMISRAKERGEADPGLDVNMAADAIMGLAWLRLLTGQSQGDVALMADTLCRGWLRADSA
ncbi:TetR/AcrR family transcriptional regulator [Actibacterium sp. D379-3]